MNSNSSPMLVTTSIYALLVLIWAATPLAIVWSVAEVHPMWVLIIRYFGASLIALALLKIMRDPLPFDAVSMKSYLAGSLNLIGAQLFIYLAANYLTSGLMALIFGLSPLIAGLIGHVILKTHKLVWLQWLGMAVAVSGLTFVFADSAESNVKSSKIWTISHCASKGGTAILIFKISSLNCNCILNSFNSSPVT